ncbi:MAG: MarR family transcriptional regulator [SAR202 cluster bacterium]|nr:MarR family transcriptional regulator [SAR202 cluster bacterium]
MTGTAQQEHMMVWEALLRTVTGLIQTFEREMEETERLPLTWYDVLIQLHEAPEGRLRMQALADLVILSRSGLTRLIDRLEKEGLVRREPSREDRRGSYAILTDKGREVLSRARPLHHRGIFEHFGRHLNRGDLLALRRVLNKLQRANPGAPVKSG